VKLRGSFLGSIVARRIFLLFLLSALIPAAIIALLSFREVRTLLHEQKRSELLNFSKASSMEIYDRLLLIEDLLKQSPSKGAGSALPSAAKGKIRSLVALQSDQNAKLPVDHAIPAVPGPGTRERRHLDAGGALLLSVDQEGAAARVFMLQSLSGRRGAYDLAEIDPDFLWGDATDLQYGIAMYAISATGQILYSSSMAPIPPLDSLMRTDARADQAYLEWGAGGDHYLGGYYAIMLEPHFLARQWTVVVGVPQSEVYGAAHAFTQAFLPVLGLAILLVILFSTLQIRRTMVPLERLIDGTRRIASHEFDARIPVNGVDEFGELAASFNGMAARLGRQFLALRTLSEIDRVILSTMDMDRVLDTVLARLPDVVTVDYLCITIMDYDNPRAGHSRAKNYVEPGESSVERTELTAEEHSELLSARDPFWSDPNDLAKSYLKPLAECKPAARLVLPVVWKDKLTGVITLAYRDPPSLGDDELARASDFRDRIAVALSSAARDEQLYYQARYDSLTALPNRLHFKDQLTQALAIAARDKSSLAVLFMDLDHFKNVNDTAGHPGGDALLQEAAARMKASVRESDFVARLGGDEFTVLMTNLVAADATRRVAEQLLHVMRTPFIVADHVRFLTASIGIAVYPEDGQTADDLIKRADTAMYRAKATGRDKSVYFEERMNSEALSRVALEEELRKAIAREEFELYYQPKIDTRSERLCGTEVLVRWNHPQRGLTFPVHFIGLAEELGLIVSLGRWILASACKHFVQSGLQQGGLRQISVNVSGRQFKQSDFVDFVLDTVTHYSMRPECLELEITESLLMEADQEIRDSLARLKSAGIRLALDDFGTGYSSLAYLKHFPIDVVKIDRAFVKDLDNNTESHAIPAAIIAMSHALGLKVVAEGVETEGQLSILRRLHCDTIQGYYYAKPLPLTQFVEFMRAEGS
jgi:diguanylate cyclase (GGDEF)-like protein